MIAAEDIPWTRPLSALGPLHEPLTATARRSWNTATSRPGWRSTAPASAPAAPPLPDFEKTHPGEHRRSRLCADPSHRSSCSGARISAWTRIRTPERPRPSWWLSRGTGRWGARNGLLRAQGGRDLAIAEAVITRPSISDRTVASLVAASSSACPPVALLLGDGPRSYPDRCSGCSSRRPRTRAR